MNLSKRKNVGSTLFQYKICLMIFLVIVMMKIVSYSCQNLSGTITDNGVVKQIFSVPMKDLVPCKGKPNCFYQNNSQKCTNMTMLSIQLNISDLRGFKPPSLIASLNMRMKSSKRGTFMDPDNIIDNDKPSELILCDRNLDMRHWADKSVIANTLSSPTSSLVFSIVYKDLKRYHTIKTITLEFSGVFIIAFIDPPECLLVDHLNHKVFWSDGNQGTIEVYDTRANKITILAKVLDMPGSMVIDPTLRLLFWCNFEITGRGSIERIHFDGSDRVDITEGKYNLANPKRLGIDLTNQMLYWTDYQVIHTSDYNGDYHKTIDKSNFYDPNFPNCFSFSTDVVEHNFFWENHHSQQFDRSFGRNYLLSISYYKDDKMINDMKLPAAFHEQHGLSQIKRRTLKIACPSPISSTNHCFLLPVMLSVSTRMLNNKPLSTGYKLTKQDNLKIFENDLRQIEIQWYVNSNTRTFLRYDWKTKNIQLLFNISQDMNSTTVYKYECHYNSFYRFKDLNMYKLNFLILDLINKSFYLLNYKFIEKYINKINDRRIYTSPRIFGYVAQAMNFTNIATSHAISFQKCMRATVYEIVFQLFLELLLLYLLF